MPPCVRTGRHVRTRFLLQGFIVTVRRLSEAAGAVAALLLAAAVLVVCQMVVMRYGLRASTIWQTEFVTYSLVAAAFVGSPYVALMKGHVNVDLLPLALPRRARFCLALLVAVLALTFSLLVCITGAQLWLESWEGGWRTDTVWSLPLWIPYAPMPIGFGLMALQYVADLLALLRGDEQPFGIETGRAA